MGFRDVAVLTSVANHGHTS